MDRYSYLNELNLLLLELPKKEREAALAYFEDYFKNHRNIEDEEIIQTIGTPLENANRIKQNFTSNGGKLHQESVVEQNSDSNMERSSYSWLWLVLSILTIPIWLPIGIVLLCNEYCNIDSSFCNDAGSWNYNDCSFGWGNCICGIRALSNVLQFLPLEWQ